MKCDWHQELNCTKNTDGGPSVSFEESDARILSIVDFVGVLLVAVNLLSIFEEHGVRHKLRRVHLQVCLDTAHRFFDGRNIFSCLGIEHSLFHLFF